MDGKRILLLPCHTQHSEESEFNKISRIYHRANLQQTRLKAAFSIHVPRLETHPVNHTDKHSGANKPTRAENPKINRGRKQKPVAEKEVFTIYGNRTGADPLNKVLTDTFVPFFFFLFFFCCSFLPAGTTGL